MFVSALAIAVMATSLWAAPGAEGLFGAMLGLVALAIADTDAREGLIPNQLSVAAALLALINTGLINIDGGLFPAFESIARAAIASGSLWLLREGYFRLRGHDGLGLGDVKLAAVAGLWLDWTTIALAIQVAAICAIAVHGGARLLRRAPPDAGGEIPFGLYLAPMIWVGWLYQQALRSI